MLSPIEIPTMLFWENGNTWYGSKGEARFFIHPSSHEDGEAPARTTLDAELWKGPLSRALSQVLAEASFPLSEDGLVQLTAWLVLSVGKETVSASPGRKETCFFINKSSQQYFISGQRSLSNNSSGRRAWSSIRE